MTTRSADRLVAGRASGAQSGERLAARLRTFFDAVALTSGDDDPKPSLRSAAPTIDEAKLRALFQKLTVPLEQARRDGSLADVWDIAGLKRNEVRNAAALAALWNPRLCGTIAVEFLTAFLARIDADENYPTREELAAGYTIRTEDRPLGRAAERVDIVLEGASFLLGIEIKIDADEGAGQLSAYRDALRSRASPRQQPPALVFLSRHPPRDRDTRHARWRHVAAAARSVAPRSPTEVTFVHRLIAQFARHVADF